MICETCKNIDFKPLSAWKRTSKETSDPSNAAFQLYYTSDSHVQQKEAGTGMLTVYYFHHDNETALITSAANGCYLCAMLSFALYCKDNQLQSENSLSFPVPEKLNKPVVLTLFLSMQCKSWQTVEEFEFIRVFCGAKSARLDSLKAFTDSPLSEYQYRAHISQLEQAWLGKKMKPYLSTWSPLNQNLAKSWYRSCLNNHDGCRSSDSVLPKRVIDVDFPNMAGQPVLWEPETQTHAKYVTLSHCWGERLPMTIIPTDYEGLWSLPPFQEWAQVFQDAVTVARAFGIRYLWIDAPCILQDSQQDWEIESGKMAQYFTNSAFTIAAARPEDGSDGLFAYRNPVMTYPFYLKLNNGTPFERYLCAATEDCFPGVAESDYLSSTLYSRGWVLQEQLLSPRILRFGRMGLYWQCRSQVQSEAVLKYEHAQPERDNQFPLQIVLPEQTKGWTHSRNKCHDAWYKILKDFNRRNISFQNDVLPALSGISEIIHGYLPPDEQFLAGIWRSDWIVGLLWCTIPASPARPDLPNPRLNFDRQSFFAPSWSWVSQAHHELNFELHPKILPPGGVLLAQPPETELVHANIQVQNDLSPYGPVKLGVLMFLAKCPRITIFTTRKPTTKISYDARILELRGTSYMSETMYCDMKTPESDFPTFFESMDRPITGDCILDDANEHNPSQRSSALNLISSIFGDRSASQIEGIFLPLLSFDTEDQRESMFRDRTLGLALVPMPESFGNILGVDQNEIKLYKRIGRAALNIRTSRLQATTIPTQFIGIV